MSKKKPKKIATLQERLDNATKSANVSTDLAKNIIIREHLLNNMYKKNELVDMTINFTNETYDIVTKISDNLKVSVSAVLCVLLEEQLKKYSE